MHRMIILGRDGVINEYSENDIKSADEWMPIPGSLEAISRLKKANYDVTLATNQSGLATGLFDYEDLKAIHDKLNDLLAQRGAAIDGIFFCPHSPSDNCVCRKPKPGLLLQIAQQFGIRLFETYFVGDSMSDIQAARMAGAKPVLVRSGRGVLTLHKYGPFEDVPIYDNLSSFTREFLRENA